MRELEALREVELAPPEVRATKAQVFIQNLEEQAAAHSLEAESLFMQHTTGWRIESAPWRQGRLVLRNERRETNKKIRQLITLARNCARGARRVREIRDSILVKHHLVWSGKQFVPAPPPVKEESVPEEA